MASKFDDIKIVAMNDEASYQSGANSQAMNIVLTLSAPAPYEWADYFNGLWKQHLYMMKRRASVSGDSLEIYCVPNELQDHIAELNKVIAETNTAYRSHFQKSQLAASERAAKEAEQRANLADLKSKLNFD